jgi:hypothetical protein
VLRLRGAEKSADPAPYAAAAVVASLLWMLYVPGLGVIDYLLLGPLAAVRELGQVAAGERSVRELFESGEAGAIAPLWQQVAATGSVLALVGVLPLGLWTLWRRRCFSGIYLTLALVACSYPVLQGLRLTVSGVTPATRSVPYVFLGLGLVGGLWFASRLDGRLPRAWLVIFVGWTALIYSGALSLYMSSWGLPAGFDPNSYTRSVDAEDLDDAKWARVHLPSGSRVGADYTNTLLMGAWGRQRSITPLADGRRFRTLIRSREFTDVEDEVLRSSFVQYLVVDRRATMRSTLAASEAAANKYEQVQGMSRLFDSGSIVIYDLRGFLAATSGG